MKRYVLLFLTAFLGLVWLNNTSLFSPGDDKPLLIAHRGLAPEMHPEHEDYLACKTDATGRLIDYSMAELKALDIGYGYYTESNRYPRRGKGFGLMPSLEEVLVHFPLKGFVVSVKSNDRSEAVRRGDKDQPHRQDSGLAGGATIANVRLWPLRVRGTVGPGTPYRTLAALGYNSPMSVNRIKLLVETMQEKASMSKRAKMIVLLVGGLVSMISVYLYLAWDLDGDFLTPLASVAAFFIVFSVFFVVAVRKIRRDEHTRSRTSGEM